MSLVRWNPWQEITTLNRQMNRLFDELSTSDLWDATQKLVRVPPAEIEETAEAIRLRLEVPGIDAKDLDIQVSENTVSVKGERKSEARTEENGVTRTEFHYGQFQRVIPLSARIQNTNVTADYKDGILHLTLPKAEAEKAKVVKVNIEQG
ncbi:MAG: Hsp20/alpha crystallin family protein [Desertifilum sp. SIO1I2]|nr:Hsp20/alpha crystallin family protein [Desertifilum sp. SIO1I2]